MTESKSPASHSSITVDNSDESKKIFVGNLPFEVQDDDLSAFFQAVGKV